MSKKGNEGGECNRTACNIGPAMFYNHSTLKWYCKTCAFDIQEFENSMPNPFCIFKEFHKGKQL